MRMTFNDAAKRRMLNGDVELVQDERGVGVKYDKLAFHLETRDGALKLVISMFAGEVMINEVEESFYTVTDGHTLYIGGLEGSMYLTNTEIMDWTKV